MKKRLGGSILLMCVTAAILSYAYHISSASQEIRHYTAFFDVEGKERSEENVLRSEIAERIGAECEEVWLKGQTREEAIGLCIANGEYPDFISGSRELYEEGALVPLDEYLDCYPNLKSYAELIGKERLQMEDGHIYWLPPYGVVRGRDSEVLHQGEAFWIQTKVLKWAGYPQIRTLDEYFDLLERYIEANPVMENGQSHIPYTILCDDWRYYCLENVPQFLDGYPNDGCCMVEPKTQTVMDYNMTPTAKRYFRKLNEEYHKGIVDVESFTASYEEYLEKLSSGRVLGMVDQWWNFAYDIHTDAAGMGQEQCHYVPLPVTIDKKIRNQWHVERSNEMDVSSGIAVTVSCQDVEGALQFINDLLDTQIQRIRFWGMPGVDYEMDENGRFYRTREERERVLNPQLQEGYFCAYAYFPRFEGVEADGNAYSPEYQPEEFLDALPDDVRECFNAYGCQTYVDMLGSNRQPGAWYPMYSYSSMLTYATQAGTVWKQMEDIKHFWLPQVVLAEDFESTWQAYTEAYQSCRPELFFKDLQEELNRRTALQKDGERKSESKTENRNKGNP